MKSEAVIQNIRPKHKKKVNKGNLILEIVMFIITIFVAYPLFVMVINVFKTPMQMYNWVALPTQFYTDNIVKVFTKSGFTSALLNSLFVTSISITILILFGSMAAYPLGRRSEKVFNYLYIYITMGIMLADCFATSAFALFNAFALLIGSFRESA